MGEAVVGRGIEIRVLTAVVVIAMGARAGLDLALGIALIAAPFRKRRDLRGIAGVVEAHAAEPFLVNVLLDQLRVIVFAVGPLGRRESARDPGAGHQDPFAELGVVGDLQLIADVASFVEHLWLQRFGDLDHVPLLK